MLRRGSGRREIAQGKHRQYYVHRDSRGRFQKWTARGKSQRVDRRKYAPAKHYRGGYGHRYDRKRK